MKPSKLVVVASCLFGMSRDIVGQEKSVRAQLMPMPLAQAESVEAALRKKTIGDATVNVDPVQEFLLRAPGAEILGIVPVLLWPGGKPENPGSCGVFFLHPNGDSQYVPIEAPGPHHTDMCMGPDAVGLMSEPGSRPRLILLFNVSSGHGTDNILPYVLAWDSAGKAYKVDQPTSDWLVNHKESDTVAGIRKLLAQSH